MQPIVWEITWKIQQRTLQALWEKQDIEKIVKSNQHKLEAIAWKTFFFWDVISKIKNEIHSWFQKNFSLVNDEIEEILKLDSSHKRFKPYTSVLWVFSVIFISIYLWYLLHNFIQRTLFGQWDQFLIPSIIIFLLLFFIPLWQRSKKIKQRKTINKQLKRNYIGLLLIWFIFIWFLIIYLGKWFFVHSYDAYFFLYIYGVGISLSHTLVFYWALYIYEDPGELAKQIEDKMSQNGIPPSQPLVSCMIAVYNEEKVLESCINSMLSQSYKNIEYIFINDYSTDKTAEILDRYAARWLIKVVHLSENMGKKKALWTAIRQAKGSIFAMSDSDSVWEKSAIEIIVRIFNHFPNVGWVSWHGRALNAHDTFFTKIQDPWYEWQFSIRKAFESIFGAVTCVSGPLAVFRREAIYNYIPAWEHDSFLGSPFRFATDRTITGYVLGSEYLGKWLKRDYESCNFKYDWKIKDKKWDIVYCKSARSKTIVPDTFKRVIKQHARWKKSFLRNIFLTGGIYWRKHFIVAMLYYLHVLLVLLWPVIAIRHLIYLPITWDWFSPILYIVGIFFVWSAFALACKLEDPESTLWRYRPLMSLFSTLVLSWLIIYSLFTIKKMSWSRD